MRPHFFLYGLSLFVHGYVALRLLPALLSAPLFAAALALWLAASTLLIPPALMAPRRRGGEASTVVWIGLIAMGALSSLFVLTFLRDLALLLAVPLDTLLEGRVPIERSARLSAFAIPPLALAITAVGYANARRIARVVDVDVPIAGLPPALHGFTIAQLSDVHVGPTIRTRYLQAIVERVNALQADVVAITGDLVDGSVAELGEHVRPLTQLRSRHGSYFVTGNHEYYSGGASWVAHLRGLGVRVLENEHVVLNHGEASLVLAGVTDWSAHHFEPAKRSDPRAALQGAPDTTRVLLAHQPRSCEAAADAGFHLQLSGHTHGGQFLPWTWFVRVQQPFVAGLRRVRGLWVYTSRGTGYWGPPKRFGAPSEITRLRLIPK